MNLNTFYGYKLRQQQTFNEKGKRIVATIIQALPLTIKQIKTQAKDGYLAYKIVIMKKNKPGVKQTFKEIRLKQEPTLVLGDKIEAKSIFALGDRVSASSLTKGCGFAGVVKRWGFAGGPKTHGQSDRERAPGSIGQRTTPGRVWKGKKMAGHMGNKLKTIKGLKVFKIDEEKKELWLQGLVPGVKGGLVKICRK